MNIKFLIENKIARKATLIFSGIVLLTNILGILLIVNVSGENTVLVVAAIIIMIICTSVTYLTIKWVNNKIHWYESMLDSIPFPISVTDKHMNWTFINRPVEEMLKLKRTDIVGKHCSNWKAGICNTRNCGIECLKNGQKTTFFDQMGADFRVDVAYLSNINGKKIGHIEVVQNVTEEKNIQKSQANLINQVRDINEVFVAASSEMTSETEKNSEMASHAAKLAETVQSKAQKGAVQMEKMTQAVQEMGDSSKAIGKVMNLINSITSQTNILSLNATVEAARAGEQGKSFAVVAEEVRNLASKSTDSANAIAPLIQDSISKADQSVEMVRETSASLNEIVSGIQESVKLIGDIAKSSEVQMASINQMQRSIDKMTRALDNN